MATIPEKELSMAVEEYRFTRYGLKSYWMMLEAITAAGSLKADVAGSMSQQQG